MKFFYPLLCYYPSEVGGSANAIYWLNNTLGKHKFKSIVVSTVCGQSGEHFDKNRMFKVHNIPDFPMLKIPAYISLDVALLKGLFADFNGKRGQMGSLA